MRKLVLLTTLLILISSCKEKKEESCYTNFTYFKGNIKMCYRLKFNSSDTVYYLDDYPFGQKGLQYFLLEKNEKKTLNDLICQLKFPLKDSVLVNNNIHDGTTIAFSIDHNRLMLHETGPKEFWKFEEGIEYLKNHKILYPIKRNVKFDKFDKMLPAPPPPIIK